MKCNMNGDGFNLKDLLYVKDWKNFGMSGECDTADASKERLRILIRKAEEIPWNPRTAVKLYIKSALEIYRMACIHQTEGDKEQAFMLFTRFTVLLLEKIINHPEFAKYKSDEDFIVRRERNQKIKYALEFAEDLKISLLAQYEEEATKLAREVCEQMRLERERRNVASGVVPAEPHCSSDNHVSFQSDTLPGVVDVNYPSFGYRNDMPALNNILDDRSDMVIHRPSIDRSSKPRPDVGSSTANASGLREILIPRDAIAKFARVAEPNTSRNVETCGILSGKAHRNRLIVTHVLIPKQHGTSDSCSTEAEEDIFFYQDKHQLLTLGWIHTHPSQTAFLSSVDLHTQFGYEVMLPEAVAVVVAPSYDQTGIFVLSPQGLAEISQCNATGFHPHHSNDLFVLSTHAKIEEGHLSSELVDLR